MQTPQQEKLRKAAEQLAPKIIPNMGKLRWFAWLNGGDTGNYSDLEMVEVIKMSCEIVLSGIRVFEFKPVYAA